MAFFPFLATVKHSERISPNFQRVTFTGVDDMGPAGRIMDLRIKLVIPGAQGLPEMSGEENWYDEWKAIDPDKRGSMRTYSIREFRRAGEHGEGSNCEAERDIGFVSHCVGTHDSGHVHTWDD